MSHRTLIVYASRAGATAEVAQAVGDILRQRGIEVDSRSVKDVTSFEDYDSVVAGSAIWVGKPLPELLQLLTAHRDAIASMPVAYFILCDTLREWTPANRQIALGYVTPLRKIKEPVNVGMFAGRRDFSTTHPLLRWFLMRVVGLVEGDWRDWEQVKAWAGTVATQLAGAQEALIRSGAA